MAGRDACGGREAGGHVSTPAPATDPRDAARALRAAVRALAGAIIKAHRGLWPADQDGSYTVIQRNGKTKVEFHPPQEKEAGWVDA